MYIYNITLFNKTLDYIWFLGHIVYDVLFLFVTYNNIITSTVKVSRQIFKI